MIRSFEEHPRKPKSLKLQFWLQFMLQVGARIAQLLQLWGYGLGDWGTVFNS